MASTIIVTGSKGQLGSELRDLAASYPAYRFVFLGREEFSISEEEKTRAVFEQYQPGYLVNCAAYTAVDDAENAEQKEIAFAVNGTAVGQLAALCKEFNTKLVHISTDYVYNGEKHQPLKESDPVGPVNAYGASKLLGEEEAVKNAPETIIIRTSWVYSTYGKNFVKTMIRLMGEKESINVVNDQQGSPTYAADLAEAILQIIDSGKWVPGIYNYSNDGTITWHEFASEIKNIIKSNCVLHTISSKELNKPAPRPFYSVLDKSKIRETYGLEIKDWKTSLRRCLKH